MGTKIADWEHGSTEKFFGQYSSVDLVSCDLWLGVQITTRKALKRK